MTWCLVRIRSGKGSSDGLADLSYLLLPFADAVFVGFLSCLQKWQESRHGVASYFYGCGALLAFVGCGLGCARGSLRGEFTECGSANSQALPKRVSRYSSAREGARRLYRRSN